MLGASLKAGDCAELEQGVCRLGGMLDSVVKCELEVGSKQ